MLKASGATRAAEIGWLSAIPYGISAVVMVLLCRSSDRLKERTWHTAIPAIVGGAALAILPNLSPSLPVTLVLLTVAASGIFSTMPLFWALATDHYSGRKSAAVAIAWINSLGLIGGFASPFAMGWLKTLTGSLTSGLYLITGILFLGAIVLIVTARTTRRPAEEMISSRA
jgi:MFS family permease